MSTTTWSEDTSTLTARHMGASSVSRRVIWWGGAIVGAAVTNAALLVNMLYLFSVLE